MKYRTLMLTISLAVLVAAAMPQAALAQEMGKFEGAFYGGGVHFGNNFGNHAIGGGAFGYHVLDSVQVFGEANFVPFQSSSKLIDFGGGLNVGFGAKGSKVIPYGLAVGGVGHLSDGGGNHAYLGFGGGLRYLLGKNWGIRPELRYQRYFVSGNALNELMFTGGVFFRFGK